MASQKKPTKADLHAVYASEVASMGTDFNLVDDPWIPVQYCDGSKREVSLMTLFRDAHIIEAMACETEHLNVTLQEWFAGIVFRAIGASRYEGGVLTGAIPESEETNGTIVPYLLNNSDGWYNVVEPYLTKWRKSFFVAKRGVRRLYQLWDEHTPMISRGFTYNGELFVPGNSKDSRDVMRELVPSLSGLSNRVTDLSRLFPEQKYTSDFAHSIYSNRVSLPTAVDAAAAARQLIQWMRRPVKTNKCFHYLRAEVGADTNTLHGQTSIGSFLLLGTNMAETLVMNWHNQSKDEWSKDFAWWEAMSAADEKARSAAAKVEGIPPANSVIYGEAELSLLDEDIAGPADLLTSASSMAVLDWNDLGMASMCYFRIVRNRLKLPKSAASQYAPFHSFWISAEAENPKAGAGAAEPSLVVPMSSASNDWSGSALIALGGNGVTKPKNLVHTKQHFSDFMFVHSGRTMIQKSTLIGEMKYAYGRIKLPTSQDRRDEVKQAIDSLKNLADGYYKRFDNLTSSLVAGAVPDKGQSLTSSRGLDKNLGKVIMSSIAVNLNEVFFAIPGKGYESAADMKNEERAIARVFLSALTAVVTTARIEDALMTRVMEGKKMKDTIAQEMYTLSNELGGLLSQEGGESHVFVEEVMKKVSSVIYESSSIRSRAKSFGGGCWKDNPEAMMELLTFAPDGIWDDSDALQAVYDAAWVQGKTSTPGWSSSGQYNSVVRAACKAGVQNDSFESARRKLLRAQDYDTVRDALLWFASFAARHEQKMNISELASDLYRFRVGGEDAITHLRIKWARDASWRPSSKTNGEAREESSDDSGNTEKSSE